MFGVLVRQIGGAFENEHLAAKTANVGAVTYTPSTAGTMGRAAWEQAADSSP